MPYQFLPEWPGEVAKHATVEDDDFYRHIKFVDMSPDELGTDPSLMSKAKSGKWIEVAGIPREAKFGARKGTAIPDVMLFPGGFFCVSERTKHLIEGLEPDTHQFLPMTYRWKDGSVAEERWLFVCGNRIKALHDGMTTLAPTKIKGLYMPGDGGEMVFSSENIGDRSFWVSADMVGYYVFMSDKAYQMFVDEDVTGLKLGADRREPIA